MTFRPEHLLRTLAAHDVDFVVIGGVAVLAHGPRRVTRDLDIIPAPTPSNYERLADALAELEATQLPVELELRELDPTDPFDVARARMLAVDTVAGGLDVFNAAEPGTPYEDLRARAIEVSYADVTVHVAGLDDLIAMKRAAGRERDLRDIADLTDRPPS